MMSKKSQQRMDATYNQYYETEFSFRKHWFGDITSSYILPNYYRWTNRFLHDLSGCKIVELGAGDGEVTDLIKSHQPTWYQSITPTEVVAEGVNKLVEKGYPKAKLADACQTPFTDNEFDVSLAYDVMHHVADPAAMAREMVRIATKKVFLIEANGASLMRRTLEYTNTYRKAGENSYFPWEYRRFFYLPEVSKIEIDPIQFVPPHFLSPFTPLTISFSEGLQFVPLLRWQCSGVRIRVTLDK